MNDHRRPLRRGRAALAGLALALGLVGAAAGVLPHAGGTSASLSSASLSGIPLSTGHSASLSSAPLAPQGGGLSASLS